MKSLFLLIAVLLTALSPLLHAQTPEKKRNAEIAAAENTSLRTADRVRAFQRYTNLTVGNRSIAKETLYRLADTLMKCPDLTGRELATLQTCVRNAAGRENNQAKRLASAELVIASGKTSAAEKNAAVRDQTEALVILGRTGDAVAAAQRALGFPGLEGSTLYSAYGNLGHVYAISGDLNKAVAVYREISRKDSSPAALRAMNTLIAAEYLYFKEFDQAVQVWHDAGDALGEAECLKTAERYAEARQAAEQVLKDAAAPERNRVTALSYFFSTDAGTREIRRRYPELAAKTDASFLYFRQLLPALKNGSYEYALEIADLLLARPRTNWPFELVCLKTVALSALNRAEEAKRWAEQSLSAHSEFTPEQKFRLRLIADLMKKPFRNGAVKSAFAAAEKEFAADSLSMKQKSTALQYAGRTLGAVAGMDRAVAEVQTFYDSLFTPRPENVYHVPYSAEPLRGYADWIALKNKPAPQPLKWKYGGGMDFLVTDVSTGGRGGGIGSEQDKERRKHTEFQSVCDENGVHFILRAWDDHAAEVEAGTLGGGCYEIYLAPGENEPYHCLLPEIGTDVFTVWYTTYPNEKARRLPKNPHHEMIYHPDGYTLFYSIPWDTFYDKLPDTPDRRWEAEFVHWSRSGGYSWNALESIHSRSTWGKLSFQIPPSGLQAIIRKQIRLAWKKYRAEKDLSRNGVLVLWQDPVLGDPEFYKKCVKPMEDTLDSYGAMIRPDMTADTMDLLRSRALPAWNEIVFRVDALRRGYLEEKFFRKETVSR